MKIPENTKLYEGGLATFWFDESGIFCALAKNVSRSLEMQKENYEFIRGITGNTKVCLLSDTTNSKMHDKETRDYMESEIPNHFKAMAVISQSTLGEVIPKLFLEMNKHHIPIQYFTAEEEAKEWLKQYL